MLVEMYPASPAVQRIEEIDCQDDARNFVSKILFCMPSFSELSQCDTCHHLRTVTFPVISLHANLLADSEFNSVFKKWIFSTESPQCLEKDCQGRA